MLRNFLKIAGRNLVKDKFYTIINVFGLALGVASCIFIIIYITDELSYDRFNSKAERTYRINEFIETEGSGERSSSAPFPVGPTLAEEYEPLIETQVRFFNFQSPTLLVSEKESEKEFNEPHVLFVDSTFFDVFDYVVLKGSKETALNDPNSVMLTESTARKYFGNAEPLGKLLRIQDQQELMVTGILADPPSNAHFTFDFLVSFSTLRQFFGGNYPRTWYWNPCWTYVVLKDGVTQQDLESKFPEFIQKFFPDFIKNETRMALQPLTAIHLTSNLEFEMRANSDERNIYVFTVIGVIILFIACMNFMNLSTARSAKRAKEVGLRKTLGSQRRQLVAQFIMESVIVAFIGVVAAIVIVVVGFPSFNILTEKTISPSVLLNPGIVQAIFAILIVAGLGSGIYPAFVLSSFIPVKVLKDSNAKTGRGAIMRKALVVVQFSLSIIMIIGTVVAINQLDFLRKSDTGFDKDQILYISAVQTPITQTYPAFKKELEQRNDIESVTGVLDVLGANHQGDNFRFEGMDRSRLFSVMWVNLDFFKTFDLKITEGRAYMENMTSDDTLSLIVNEALARNMNWKPGEIVGRSFDYNQFHGKIVGVVEDFNFVSKHDEIGPLVIQLRSDPNHFNFSLKYIAIKLNSSSLQNTVGFIESKWKELVPGRPFDYFFLDQELDKLYKDEERLGKIAGLFSGLAVIVACLGLFALASYMTEERKKEIGIRKVMGSSVPQIVVLLSKDFTRLILIAFTIACPVAWYALNVWLETFAFHTEISPLLFVLVGFITLGIALLTISYRALQAAFLNPAETMRHE